MTNSSVVRIDIGESDFLDIGEGDFLDIGPVGVVPMLFDSIVADKLSVASTVVDEISFTSEVT